MNQKYEVKEKTTITAHLEKKSPFSIISFVFLLLFGILPGLIYLVWYLFAPKDIVLLDIKTQSK